MTGPSGFIVDSDLHGLVDGHIEAGRRADALRRLAGSPADRARVEAWQGQNDMLRSAFAGVEHEPLPAMLDLTPKLRLQCIPANDSPLEAAVNPSPRTRPRRRRYGLVLATMLLIGMGLGGAWIALDPAGTAENATATKAAIKMDGSVAATLATRSLEAVGKSAPAGVADAGDRLPRTDIPDLRKAGFTFTGAEIEATEPASILFRYQNSAGERVVVSVARSSTDGGTAPVRIGDAYGWHARGNAFAVAGTPPPTRLHAIAVALQGGRD